MNIWVSFAGELARPGTAPELPVEATALVQAYQRASKADATVRAYRATAEALGVRRTVRSLRLPVATGEP
ncbi:hypothetical protein [Methylobacterium oryzisoli]|uniref:hypothetical protein n=1 Tax=Methylobacterium oryzisoli TaxID=3385502 RepID=UPI0038922352